MCIKVEKITQNTFEMINWRIVEKESQNLLSNKVFTKLCELRRKNDEWQQQREKHSNLEAHFHQFSFRWMLVHLCERQLENALSYRGLKRILMLYKQKMLNRYCANESFWNILPGKRDLINGKIISLFPACTDHLQILFTYRCCSS